MVRNPVLAIPFSVTAIVEVFMVVGLMGSEKLKTMRVFTGTSVALFAGVTLIVGEVVSADPDVVKLPLKVRSRGIPSRLLMSLVTFRV